MSEVTGEAPVTSIASDSSILASEVAGEAPVTSVASESLIVIEKAPVTNIISNTAIRASKVTGAASVGVQATSIFTGPGALANKALWLRGKDLTEANGALVSTWLDQSGTNHHGVASATQAAGNLPKVVDGATPSGSRAIQFDGGGKFELGNVLAAGESGYEAWVVVKSEQTIPQPNGLWWWSNVEYYSAYPADMNTSTYLYEQFVGSSYTYAYISPPIAVQNVWHVYRVTYQGTALKMYLDGPQIGSGSTVSSAFSSNVWLGEGHFGSSRYPFRGKIAEVFVRKQISTTQEAADLLTYFQQEHLVYKATGLAPVDVKSRYPIGDVPELTGLAPVTSVVSDASIFASTITGDAPVDVKAESLFVAELSGYPGEASEILIKIELSGEIDPLFPAPVPPVDFDGLEDPTVAPTLTKSDTADGHLLVGTYRYSYAAWKGSPAQATAPSPTADITLSAEDTVTLTYPTIVGADGYLVYREDL